MTTPKTPRRKGKKVTKHGRGPTEQKQKQTKTTRAKRDGALDLRLLDQCCFFQMTRVETACILDIDPDTLDRRIKKQLGFTSYADYFKLKAPGGIASLRRRQIAKALEGDNVMLIWTGKQYMGQTEKGEMKINTTSSDTVAASIRALLHKKRKRRRT